MSQDVAVVRTSDDARDKLRMFGRRHSVSMAALIEVFARRLPDGDETELTPYQAMLLKEAREIDSIRRSRG